MTEKAQTTLSVLAFAVSLIAAGVSLVSLYNQFYRTERSGWVFTNSVNTPNSVSDTSTVAVSLTLFNNGSEPIIINGPVLYSPAIELAGRGDLPDSTIHVRWADRNTRVFTDADAMSIEPSAPYATNMRKRVIMPMERVEYAAVSDIGVLYRHLLDLDSTRFESAVFDVKASMFYQTDTTEYGVHFDVNKFLYGPGRGDFVGFMPNIGKAISMGFSDEDIE